MNTWLQLVVRLQDVGAVILAIEDAYLPNIIDLTVREYRIKPDFPLPLQIAGDQDPHDYLDSPLCRIGVGLHRFNQRELDDQFLSHLASKFTILDSFMGPLMPATLETSLEEQQRHWRILDYKVIDPETCT